MYTIIITSLIAGLIAQTTKLLINSNKTISLKNITAYSGMPSSHTAIVISLATVVGLQENFNSPLFGFAFIFAILIIRDAVGLRQYLSRHGKILNALVRDLGDDDVLDEKYPKLIEKIGHTPAQVAIGAIIGIVVGITGFYII